MTHLIRWLPLGHVTHGYRRVFIVNRDQLPQFVVVIAPMPYETVYHVQQSVKNVRVEDPSLLWGLSIVTELLKSGIPEDSDDGYIQVKKPPFLTGDLIPTKTFFKSEELGYFPFELN